jgi:hypothetical protein
MFQKLRDEGGRVGLPGVGLGHFLRVGCLLALRAAAVMRDTCQKAKKHVVSTGRSALHWTAAMSAPETFYARVTAAAAPQIAAQNWASVA